MLFTGDLPDDAAWAEPYPRRMRAFLGGQVVLDSERGWMLHAPGRLPALWFPADDIDEAALPESALQDFADGQGPVSTVLAGFRSLAPEAVDRWFVEDEPVSSNARQTAVGGWSRASARRSPTASGCAGARYACSS